MSLKKHIFDSHQEKKLFKHLNSIWRRSLNIYPQLPFTKIFNIETLKIKPKEKDFLLKTNIDYTICDKEDKPLMCIEFDGLSKGFNRGGEYIQLIKDTLRKKKLELKLKIALEHNFPFYIISYDERKYISENIHLTVLDGIIGQTIAKMGFQNKINEYLERSSKEVSTMSKYEKDEFIQDMVISAEVELELSWDPIARKAAKLNHILIANGIISSWSSKYLSEPELPEIKLDSNIEDLKESLDKRLESWNDIMYHGCEVECETSKGRVKERAWIRNFEGMLVSPLIIVKNIAELLAFYKAATINEIEI